MRPPKIKSIKPAFAIEGGKIIIEGTGFDPEEVTSLKIAFDGLESRPLFISKNRIVTIVPDQASRGPVTVTLNQKAVILLILTLGKRLRRMFTR